LFDAYRIDNRAAADQQKHNDKEVTVSDFEYHDDNMEEMSDDAFSEEVAIEKEEEQLEPQADFNEEEYEEINSEEVDRVVAVLEELAENVESENIRVHLTDAANAVYSLVYEEADAGEGEEEIAVAA